MDDIAKKEPYRYCGVHQKNPITAEDRERQDMLGTVWQRNGTKVLLDHERTLFVRDQFDVPIDTAMQAYRELVRSNVALDNGTKKLDDFPVDPTCEVPMAAKSQTSNKQVATRRPNAFRPTV
jgi:hypothetical protein